MAWYLPLCVFFLCNIVICVHGSYEDDALYLIRSTPSNLVLDGSNSKVSMQHFDGYKPQLWNFKKGLRPGLFVIVNNSTGNVLDVASDNTVVLGREKNGTLNQQWFLHFNGRLVNAGIGKLLDVRGGKFVAGNPLIVHPDNGSGAQDFIVKEKQTCGN
ncbi:uncharacterized protein LOC135124207 isoform X2 [Zophobas morio]|uniref:uncharacterized protein LOC135124207 isoform X2 n=1 Tax=Zophobas morio TaxID=2755281 RepID=UPI0030839FA8